MKANAQEVQAVAMISAVRATLRTQAGSLPPAEAAVVAYILDDPPRAVRSSIERLADEADVSPATIVRAVRRLGFAGFASFKLALASELGRVGDLLPTRIEPGDDAATVLRKVVEADVDALRQTAELVDASALEAVCDVLDAAARIEVYGVGTSAPIAMDAGDRLRRLGLPASPVLDPHMQSVSAAQLGPRDVAFVVSHTGRTPDTLAAAAAARDAGATVVALTSHDHTPLTRRAHHVLLAATAESALETEAVASRIAHLSIIDAIGACLVLRRPERASTASASDAIVRAKRVQP